MDRREHSQGRSCPIPHTSSAYVLPKWQTNQRSGTLLIDQIQIIQKNLLGILPKPTLYPPTVPSPRQGGKRIIRWRSSTAPSVSQTVFSEWIVTHTLQGPKDSATFLSQGRYKSRWRWSGWDFGSVHYFGFLFWKESQCTQSGVQPPWLPFNPMYDPIPTREAVFVIMFHYKMDSYAAVDVAFRWQVL